MFETPLDFFERVDPRAINRRVVDNLIKAGAFDFSGQPRATLAAALDELMTEGARKRRDRETGQALLFGAPAAGKPAKAFRYPEVPEWGYSEKLELEKGVIGLYLSGHPMQAHGHDVARFATCEIGGLRAAEPDTEVRLVGIASEIKTIKTRRGDRMAFVVLEDANATVEVVFFAEPWIRSHAALRTGRPVLVTGRLEHGEDSVKVRGKTVETLLDARVRAVRGIRLRLRLEEVTAQRLDGLDALVKQEHGECPVKLSVTSEGQFTASFDLPSRTVSPTIALEEGMLALFGRSGGVEMQ